MSTGVALKSNLQGSSSENKTQNRGQWSNLHKSIALKNRASGDGSANQSRPSISSKDIIKKGGIDVETKADLVRDSKARNLGMPGPKNLLDPVEYAAGGGDIAHFRSDKPSGVIGVSDLGYVYDDLLSGFDFDGGD